MTKKERKKEKDRIYDEHCKQQELKEIRDTVEFCLKCEPLQIEVNEKYGNGLTKVTHLARIGGTKMIDKYRGCGDGLAFIKKGKIIAFQYGREYPFKVPQANNVRDISFSCTQICFCSNCV